MWHCNNLLLVFFHACRNWSQNQQRLLCPGTFKDNCYNGSKQSALKRVVNWLIVVVKLTRVVLKCYKPSWHIDASRECSLANYCSLCNNSGHFAR